MRRRHVRFDAVDFKSLFQVGIAHQFLVNFCLRSEPLHPGAVTVPERMSAHVSDRWHCRGMQRLSWWLGNIFPSRNSVILAQGQRKYKIYLNDGYWTRLLSQGFRYESHWKKYSL